MDIFNLQRGDAPLLISVPHDGIRVPERIEMRLTAAAVPRPDVDWHIARLYAFAKKLGATLLVPHYCRYVVDLNRPPDGAALYPGKNETGLCPLQTFAGEPIYQTGQEPSADEIGERVETFWRPYHSVLQTELHDLIERHKQVVLWEGHSIRSHVPLFFDGKLPDFNLGTVDGKSCSSDLQVRLTDALATQADYTWVANGRFKGGYITRQYGNPKAGVNAVQLELAQCNYMDESSFAYNETAAVQVQKVIERLLRVCTKGL